MGTSKSTPSISSDDAAALPLTLRRIARAFLDRDHLRAAAGVPTEAAEQAVADERCGAVLAALADGFTVVEGSPAPGVCTVRDVGGRSRLYLHYREAQEPVVEVFGENGEALGVAHLAVQFPLAAGEE